jgi:hypothetical protein
VFQIETKKTHELSISNQAIAVLRLLNVRTVLLSGNNNLFLETGSTVLAPLEATPIQLTSGLGPGRPAFLLDSP